MIDYLQFGLIRATSLLRVKYVNWLSVIDFIKKEDFQFMSSFFNANWKINRNEDEIKNPFMNSCLNANQHFTVP